MNLANCPACAREISPRAPVCPHCGEPFRAVRTTPQTSPVTWFLTLLAVIFLFVLFTVLLDQ